MKFTHWIAMFSLLAMMGVALFGKDVMMEPLHAAFSAPNLDKFDLKLRSKAELRADRSLTSTAPVRGAQPATTPVTPKQAAAPMISVATAPAPLWTPAAEDRAGIATEPDLPQRRADPTPPHNRTASTAKVPAATASASGSVAAGIDTLLDEGRLVPDRRLLVAFQSLNQLGTGKRQRLSVNFVPKGSGWQVWLGKRNVARLNDLPRFDQTLSLLRQQATKVIKRQSGWAATPVRAKSIGHFDPARLIRTLDQVDTTWNSGTITPADLTVAADALARLAFVTADTTDGNGLLPAQALAALALAQVASGQPLYRIESQLAEAMGYPGHARQMARKLPPADTWRLYMDPYRVGLEKAAAKAKSTSDRHYLWLRAAAEQRWDMDWKDQLTRRYKGRLPASVADLLYQHSHQLPPLDAARLAPEVVLSALVAKPPAIPLTDPGRSEAFSKAVAARIKGGSSPLLDRFARVLTDASKSHRGPFMDREVYASMARARMQSALFAYAGQLLSRFPATEATSRFNQRLGQGHSPDHLAWRRWMEEAAAEQVGNGDFAARLTTLDRLTTMGPNPLMQALEVPLMGLNADQRKATQTVVTHQLDSRPAHRRLLAQMAAGPLAQPTLADTLYNSLVDGHPNGAPLVQAELAYRAGRMGALLALAEQDRLAAYTRARILTLIDDPEVYWGRIRVQFERLVNSAPGDWRIRRAYVGQLMRIEDFDAIRELARQWLDQAGIGADWQELAEARAALARALIRMNQPGAAARSLRPHLNNQTLPVLTVAIDAHLLMGDSDKALKLAHTLARRYPARIDAVLPLVMVQWHMGDLQQAAVSLRNLPRPMAPEVWQRVVGTAFAKAWAGQPKKARDAIQALTDAGIDNRRIDALAKGASRARKA